MNVLLIVTLILTAGGPPAESVVGIHMPSAEACQQARQWILTEALPLEMGLMMQRTSPDRTAASGPAPAYRRGEAPPAPSAPPVISRQAFCTQ